MMCRNIVLTEGTFCQGKMMLQAGDIGSILTLPGLELSTMNLGLVKGILLLDQFLHIHQFSYILHRMGLLWARLFMFGDIPL
jgi:hypothetical protein